LASISNNPYHHFQGTTVAEWYALRSKPNKEDFVWQQVTSRGFESYYPRIAVRPVNPRARKSKPYFPGYLFVKAELSQVGESVFQWLPDGLGLVSFGGKPAPVDEALILDVQRHLEVIAKSGGQSFYGLRPGDEVAIQRGPFAGYRAIFDAGLQGKDRVRVLLEFLGSRSVTLEIDASSIKPRR
jgi:transcription antitermination factor NusG